MKDKTNRHQIYDNAFLSGCAWHKRLLIPLINEIFHKDIPEDAEIEHMANEQFKQGTNKKVKDSNASCESNKDIGDRTDTADTQNTLVKRITDALIRVNGKSYHFECESKNDGEILVRIGDYDMQIAISDATYENYAVEMELPETAVVFLRNHRKVPSEGMITYHKGDQKLTHTIPFLKVGQYTLEQLSEKHLYILFPFYIMRYEHAIKHTPDKHEMIEKEAKMVYDTLTDTYQKHQLTKTEYENMTTLCVDVVTVISQNTEVQGRMVKAMGNEVLLTAEERGEMRGKEIGKEIGEKHGAFNMALANIKSAMNNGNLSFDKVCDLLGIKDKEQYRSYVE